MIVLTDAAGWLLERPEVVLAGLVAFPAVALLVVLILHRPTRRDANAPQVRSTPERTQRRSERLTAMTGPDLTGDLTSPEAASAVGVAEPAWTPLLREDDRDSFVSWVQIEAEDHQPESNGPGCTCGFCVWSIDHVIAMAIHEVWDYRALPASADTDPKQ